MTRPPGTSKGIDAILLVVVLLAGCGAPQTTPPSTAVVTPSPSPTVILRTHEETAAAFLSAYEVADYATMYGLLSPPNAGTTRWSRARIWMHALRRSPATLPRLR